MSVASSLVASLITDPPPLALDRMLAPLDAWLMAYGRLVWAKLSLLLALDSPVCLLFGVVGAVRNCCHVLAEEFLAVIAFRFDGTRPEPEAPEPVVEGVLGRAVPGVRRPRWDLRTLCAVLALDELEATGASLSISLSEGAV